MFQKELQQSIVHVKLHWKSNLSKEERAEIDKIKNDDSVRVLGTDKKLGPAVLQTDWVKAETLNHLNDSNSCCVITQKERMQCRYKVIERREQLMFIFDHSIDDTSVTYLRSFDECSRHSESNPIELFFNRTQSNLIRGLSSIGFGNRTESNSHKKLYNRTQSNVRFSNS